MSRATTNAPCDPRLAEAIDIDRSARDDDGCRPLQNSYEGKTYSELERLGTPSRGNTLRAQGVLEWWDGVRKRDQSCSQQSACSFLACCMNMHHVQKIEIAAMVSQVSIVTLVDPTDARTLSTLAISPAGT